MAAGTQTHASSRLDTVSLDRLFLTARTHNRWLPQAVDDTLLRELYELARMAPTSANSQPVRLVFLTSREAKERLRPAPGRDQCGQDDDGARHRHRGPRPGLL